MSAKACSPSLWLCASAAIAKALERERFSQWMLFDEDLAAHVSRQSDGQEFILGLAELEVVDKKSRNYQLLDDYVVFFVNNR